MHPSWKEQLAGEFERPYFRQLAAFVKQERKEHMVFPPAGDVFNAFEAPFESVRVCILGQDPYHNAGQAHGLCFSVQKGVTPPPSLGNIFKELEADVPGFKRPAHGCLTPWVEQGVLLLNAVLTVRAHEPASHQGQGWETFTDAVLARLSGREQHMVFILWGRFARSKLPLIATHHTVFESAHPSPMSARNGFFGSRPFSATNNALEAHGQTPIDWKL